MGTKMREWESERVREWESERVGETTTATIKFFQVLQQPLDADARQWTNRPSNQPTRIARWARSSLSRSSESSSRRTREARATIVSLSKLFFEKNLTSPFFGCFHRLHVMHEFQWRRQQRVGYRFRWSGGVGSAGQQRARLFKSLFVCASSSRRRRSRNGAIAENQVTESPGWKTTTTVTSSSSSHPLAATGLPQLSSLRPKNTTRVLTGQLRGKKTSSSIIFVKIFGSLVITAW